MEGVLGGSRRQRVRAHRIKAHLTREQSESTGVPGLAWVANSRADELAEESAQQNQVDGEAVEELQALDGEAAQVLERLTAVAMQVAKEAPKLYGPSSRFARRAAAKAPAQQRREATAQALANTQHR